jgi:DNA sulfur modification protein DndE
MENPIKQFTISETAKEQLIKLKRNTKIEQWNILCRWAFCRSLAEPTTPAAIPVSKNSNVELTWEVFGGEIADILLIALKQRCYQDGLTIDGETLKQQFRLHLHRGIGYLAGDANLKNIQDLVALVFSF